MASFQKLLSSFGLYLSEILALFQFKLWLNLSMCYKTGEFPSHLLSTSWHVHGCCLSIIYLCPTQWSYSPCIVCCVLSFLLWLLVIWVCLRCLGGIFFGLYATMMQSFKSSLLIVFEVFSTYVRIIFLIGYNSCVARIYVVIYIW